MPDLVDLEIMMLSRVPIIVIETFEEPRALELIARAGLKQQKPVFSWSVTEGIQRIDMTHEKLYTLSAGTKAILGKMDGTVEVRVRVVASHGTDETICQ